MYEFYKVVLAADSAIRLRSDSLPFFAMADSVPNGTPNAGEDVEMKEEATADVCDRLSSLPFREWNSPSVRHL
jgi:hypothetical protein